MRWYKIVARDSMGNKSVTELFADLEHAKRQAGLIRQCLNLSTQLVEVNRAGINVRTVEVVQPSWRAV